MVQFITAIHHFVWGVPALALILAVGMYLTWKTGCVQLTMFSKAVRAFLRTLSEEHASDGVSSFRALCTALGATVGTGNIIGVAGAICLGGPGSIFWMWICGILGMVTKYAEVTLAVRFRVPQGDGFAGGPMYTISGGLGNNWRPLAVCYSFFGLAAALGVGNAAQINAVISQETGEISQFPRGIFNENGNLLNVHEVILPSLIPVYHIFLRIATIIFCYR